MSKMGISDNNNECPAQINQSGQPTVQIIQPLVQLNQPTTQLAQPISGFNRSGIKRGQVTSCKSYVEPIISPYFHAWLCNRQIGSYQRYGKAHINKLAIGKSITGLMCFLFEYGLSKWNLSLKSNMFPNAAFDDKVEEDENIKKCFDKINEFMLEDYSCYINSRNNAMNNTNDKGILTGIDKMLYGIDYILTKETKLIDTELIYIGQDALTVIDKYKCAVKIFNIDEFIANFSLCSYSNDRTTVTFKFENEKTKITILNKPAHYTKHELFAEFKHDGERNAFFNRFVKLICMVEEIYDKEEKLTFTCVAEGYHGLHN